jgi:hypothetical protein
MVIQHASASACFASAEGYGWCRFASSHAVRRPTACDGSLLAFFLACERRTSLGDAGEIGSGEEGFEMSVRRRKRGVVDL